MRGLLTRVLAPVALVVSFGLTASCATGRIAVDYDADTDFSGFGTYAWVDAPREGAPNPVVDDNALLDKRVRAAVDPRLRERGLRPASPGEADLTIHYHVMLSEEQLVLSSNDYEVGQGGNVVAVERRDLVSFTHGTFILDIHERSRDALVWRGIARDVVDDALMDTERLDQMIERAVNEMLERFPP